MKTAIRSSVPEGEKFTLSLKFKVKPGLKLALLAELKTILDLCAREPEFITAILHENPEQPEEIFLFELWRGTREEFLRVQGPKPYRVAYLERSRPLLTHVDVAFLQPTQEWGSALLAR
jgi:quinol monooxygenase YgiN